MRNIFEISKSGLFAARQSMNSASHNIANANTPGYTRQRTELSAEVLRKNGFTLGRGVSVEQVQRLRHNLTDQQIRLKENELGNLNEQARIFQQIESVLVSSSGDDLDVAMSDFFNSFSELSNNPQDKNLRDVVVSKARSLTDKFQNITSDLADIQERVMDSAQVKVDKVNNILESLADTNADVARAEATGHPDLGGKDQQAELMKELSELVNVDATYNADGTVEARIGGIVVLNDQNINTLKADTGGGGFSLQLEQGKEIDPGVGALSADIQLLEEDLPGIQQELDELATSFAEGVNEVHASGYGLSDGTGRTFFEAGATTAGALAINSEILENPDHIATSSEQGEAGNNDIALQIGRLQDDRSLAGGRTINDAIIKTMNRPGLKLNELEQNIQSKESARQMLVNQQQSESGVNVDEELSNLIKYQNAYQASAKVLNAGQQMYDTLLGIL